MVYSPFDFNEAVAQRREFAEEGLREGSPVVGVSHDAGILLLTMRKSQRKVFEIYDRLVFSAIGNQSDVEQIRIGAIDVAHREGFERSPDDVTAQRLVGFSLSPPLKRLFGDQFNAPAVVRAVFGEMGRTPHDDVFYVLNYDGDFVQTTRFAAVAGSQAAEDRMLAELEGLGPESTLNEALTRALRAWAAGAYASRGRRSEEEPEEGSGEDALERQERIDAFLREQLGPAQVEVGVLERSVPRESKFRLLGDSDLEEVLRGLRD